MSGLPTLAKPWDGQIQINDCLHNWQHFHSRFIKLRTEKIGSELFVYIDKLSIRVNDVAACGSEFLI